jgi:hypothetical protein
MSLILIFAKKKITVLITLSNKNYPYVEYRVLESVIEHTLDSFTSTLLDHKDHRITQLFWVVYLSRCDFSIRFSTNPHAIYLGIVLYALLNTLRCRLSHTAIRKQFFLYTLIGAWQQFQLSDAGRQSAPKIYKEQLIPRFVPWFMLLLKSSANFTCYLTWIRPRVPSFIASICTGLMLCYWSAIVSISTLVMFITAVYFFS